MAIEVTIPRLGWSMEKGTFIEWRKKEGDRVSSGDVLFVIEGDKAEQEVESFDSGILHIASGGPAQGDEVPVGLVVGWLLAPGEAPPAKAAPETASPMTAARMEAALETPARLPAETQAGLPAAQIAVRVPAPTAVAAGASRRIAASPRARRVAGELGVDWRALAGSGRTGRIVERDVREAASARRRQRDAYAAAGSVQKRGTLAIEVDASALSALLTTAGRSPRRAPLERSSLLLRLVRAAADEPCALVDPLVDPMPASEPAGGARLAILDLGGLGVDAWTPSSPLAWPLVISLGRIRKAAPAPEGPSQPRMLVSLSYDEEKVPLARAAEMLDRVRSTIERPYAPLLRQ